MRIRHFLSALLMGALLLTAAALPTGAAVPMPEARELGEKFARLSGYTLDETPYESSFAGYKDWFIQNFRRPGYTIEVGEGENPLPLSQFDEIYRDNIGIMSTAALGE